MALSTCIVSGTIQTLLGAAVTNATITAYVPVPFFADVTLITGEQASTTTASDGTYSLTVIRTLNYGQKITFRIKYYDGTANYRTVSYSVYIPNQSTADLADLVAAQVNDAPATATFPAQNVTITAISGISATEVQTALSELETEKIDHGAIVDSDVASAAAITRNKLASGTASHVLINNGSGVMTSEAQLAVSRGGTGIASYATGDIPYASGATTISSLAIGSAAKALVSSGSVPQYQAMHGASSLINLSLAASVASHALTVSLKTGAGSTASATDPAYVGFRSATSATGTYALRSITGALSVVVSSGSTLGHASSTNQYIYVYAIDNAGTVELAVSSILFDEGSIVTTTAEGGAGAADSNAAIYSTTARSNVAVRLLGRMLSNQSTAGTWDAAPTEISLLPAVPQLIAARYKSSASLSVTNGATVIIDYATKDFDTHNAATVGASWKYTAPKAGLYVVNAAFTYNQANFTAASTPLISLFKNGSEATNLRFVTVGTNVTSQYQNLAGATTISLAAGDYIDIRTSHGESAARTQYNDNKYNYIDVRYLGMV